MSGWLEGFPRRERKRRRTRPVELEDEDDEAGLVCVAWLPIRCPHCKSKHQRNYKTKGRLRYHLCQDCGQRFKSYELAPNDAPAVGPE